MGTYKKEWSEGEWGGLWRIKGMDIDSIGTGAGPSFLEGSGTVNSVSGLILSSNLLYNLYSFAQESVHWKIISHWRWHMWSRKIHMLHSQRHRSTMF